MILEVVGFAQRLYVRVSILELRISFAFVGGLGCANYFLRQSLRDSCAV